MHREIDLPLTRWETWGGAAVVCGLASLAMFAPTDLLGRLGLMFLIAITGALQWRLHLKRRPCKVCLTADGQCLLQRADQRVSLVASMLPGVVSPWFVAVRCRTEGGERIDLLVPGSALSPTNHWHLRRGIIGFRNVRPPGQSTAPRGR